MRELIKFELYKIFSRKSVWVLIIGVVLFSASPVIIEKINLSKHGIKSVNEIYEALKPYEGSVLTLEGFKDLIKKSEEIRDKIKLDEELTKDEFIYYNYLFDARVDINPNYYINGENYTYEDIKKEINRLEDINETDTYEYKNLNYVYSLIKNKEQPKFFFKGDWTKSMDFNVIATLISTSIAIGVATVFSDEYQSNSASIMLSSRNGRGKLVLAKIVSSLIFTTISFVLIHSIYSIYTAMYNFIGWDLPLNSLIGYEATPFDISIIKFYITGLGVSFIGAILFTLVAILISLVTKNNMISLIITLGMYYLPSFLAGFSITEGVGKIVSEINFAEAIRIQGMFRTTNIYNILGNPTLYSTVLTSLVLISIPIAMYLIRYFGKKQSI
ncbi:ABC transporter permease [[Clostridium] dakarense]|uniref:ABC transporter permease n=1 Tax=Faecalimicrobium dakarense TaxID=1301100 RepID=UPI0004ACB833|nr:ABC transporter permease subunit [[Clostridium] dakarense]